MQIFATINFSVISRALPEQQLQILFDNYKVLVYNGLLDIICAQTLTLNWILSLQWSKSDEFKQANRQI